MIISNNNKYQYEMRLDSTPEQIESMIKNYYEQKPILDELKDNGIVVTTLYYMRLKDSNQSFYVDESIFLKAMPILITWLKKDKLSYVTKSEIVSVLIDRSVSKQHTFGLFLSLFKSVDRDNLLEKEFKSHLCANLGIAFTRWTDDENVATVFALINDKSINNDEYRLSFLLESLANLKESENRKKAIKILMKELQIPNRSNMLIYTTITSLRKLKAVEAEALIEPYISHENRDVRNDAKKAIRSFEKIKRNNL
jgi:hypothetical protein